MYAIDQEIEVNTQSFLCSSEILLVVKAEVTQHRILVSQSYLDLCELMGA